MFKFGLVISLSISFRMAQEPVVSKEDSNYFKIATLLLRVAPRAVKIKFDDVLSPENLKESLKSYRGDTDDLKITRLIDEIRWNMWSRECQIKKLSSSFSLYIIVLKLSL